MFALDVLACPRCGGRLRVMAIVQDPAVVRALLAHVGGARLSEAPLFRLVAEVLHAIEAGVFHPNPGWACKDCPFRGRCWAWG